MGTAINTIGLSIIIGKYILMAILATLTLFDGTVSPELLPATLTHFNE
ncbi:hypothetical protein [Photobacterium leiognathi]|nr:hypothetical protein [Photobacterium leiognathi]